MEKVEITQAELNQGDGQFHLYMNFVLHRLSAKFIDPKLALFNAVDVILGDGHHIHVGSIPDEAGVSVANWLDNVLGRKANISYCLPPVAYQLHGISYLLRMPVLCHERFLLTQAVIDLKPELANALSDKQIARLELDFNEFYDALFVIARLDATTVIHMESAAQRICEGAVHFALSRWESLHFVERAMKEVLELLGVEETGSKGHDIAGVLHTHWVREGKNPLPQTLLDDVQCLAKIRYEKSPLPFLATLRAHHSSIRLAAIIAAEIPPLPKMNDKMILSSKELQRSPLLEIVRSIPALSPDFHKRGQIKLIRD
jgi:hypothetical protein